MSKSEQYTAAKNKLASALTDFKECAEQNGLTPEEIISDFEDIAKEAGFDDWNCGAL